jgi:hypothetical protein
MNVVETVLIENIDKPGSLFIFPTDVAASRWADQVLHLRGGTIAMEQFIAWDTFKQNSIRSKMQNRRSVPAVLRKIFVSRLIRENAERCGQGQPPVFSSLIRVEWARQAASFTGWLTELLPQLGAWFRQTTGLTIALITGTDAAKITADFEGDDRDLCTLALRYAQFLEQHGLFEPAWETPPFDDTGKECFIFFPESLSDYGEYRDLLAASGHVQTICAEDGGAEGLPHNVFFYTNSRSEITEAALYIRALHERNNAAWDSIAVSIPDENYEPYVLREFANRNIPFVKRTGKPLASYPAGQFFKAAADCASRDFAFSALVSLLLNRHLPWKNSEAIQKLIDFGITNNCISSWIEEENGEEKTVNVWEDAFAAPCGYIDWTIRRFFEDLRRRINALCRAGSFAEVRRQYFSFRERFFDMEQCLPETDLVLSRCVSELMYLVEIEKSFPDSPAPNPFMFFTEYLGEVYYLAQQSASGVVILPYRTAAPAPFDCHVILGAGQDSLSAVFTRLGFLPRNKREKLKLVDDDASAAFINLHQYNSRLPAAFFCAEQTFSGYAIPHSRLDILSKPRDRYGEDPLYREQFSEDMFRAENNFYNGIADEFPRRLHENQKTGFEAWQSRRGQTADSGEQWNAGEPLPQLIRERFCRNPRFPGKCGVSASSLAPYYQCSLKWLFERVLDLVNVRIETGLMAENIAGQVYHAALHLFFAEFKKNGTALPPPLDPDDGNSSTSGLPPACRDLLLRCVNSIFDGFPALSSDVPSADGTSAMSALTTRLLRSQQKQFYAHLEKTLAVFLAYFAGWRVLGSEVQYQSEMDCGFLNGTVDCILEDTRADSETGGAVLIVDFKLKNLPKRADCAGTGENGLANFQLPMYLALTEAHEHTTVQTALFFSVIDAEPLVLFGAIQNPHTRKWKPGLVKDRITRESELFERIMGEFREKAERFAREAGSGKFSVFPDARHFDQCNRCEYHRVCRTVYKIDREENITTWGNFNGI